MKKTRPTSNAFIIRVASVLCTGVLIVTAVGARSADPPLAVPGATVSTADAVAGALAVIRNLLPVGTREELLQMTAIRIHADVDIAPNVPTGTVYWRVVVPRTSLEVGPRASARLIPDREIVVFLDERAAAPLRVEISAKGFHNAQALEPDPSWYIQQMGAVGPERWSTCTDPPKTISLRDAIDTVEAQGLGSAAAAERIVVYYITWHFSRAPAIPAWSIDLRGLPPDVTISGDQSGKPFHLRHIVDASNGKWRTATTVPPDRIDLGTLPTPIPKDQPAKAGAQSKSDQTAPPIRPLPKEAKK